LYWLTPTPEGLFRFSRALIRTFGVAYRDAMRSNSVPVECKDSASGYLLVVSSNDRDRKDAFESLILPEIPMLLRVALSLTHQSADANDLVQETMLKSWRSFDTFDGQYPRAWLLTIMRNAHRNSFRKAVPDPVDPVAVGTTLIEPAPQPSAEAEAMLTEMDHSVVEGLNSLKPDVRELVILVDVDVDGLSYREAAATLGLAEGTVMSRLHRARAKIRKRVVADRKRIGSGRS